MITVETLGSSSKGNCYRLLSGGRSLLLECGLPWKEIRCKLNFETTKLDGCLCTHYHKDHSRSLCDVLNSGVPVYASRETFDELSASNHHRAHKLTTSLLSTDIGEEWRVVAFDTVHDTPGSLGFQITTEDRDNLVFITDTAYCKYRFNQINVLMIEANFSDAILRRNIDAGLIDTSRAKRVRENHMSIERVVDFLNANDLHRCRAIHLLHLSDGNSDAVLFKRMVQEATGIPTFVEG
jgi:phosphoribosyl 1,2-cyclic phosphodiesterase